MIKQSGVLNHETVLDRCTARCGMSEPKRHEKNMKRQFAEDVACKRHHETNSDLKVEVKLPPSATLSPLL